MTRTYIHNELTLPSLLAISLIIGSCDMSLNDMVKWDSQPDLKQKELSLVLSFDRDTVIARAETNATIVLKNTGIDTLTVSNGLHVGYDGISSEFYCEILKEHGEEYKGWEHWMVDYQRTWLEGAERYKELASGDSLSSSFDFQEWFKLIEPGIFKIRAVYHPSDESTAIDSIALPIYSPWVEIMVERPLRYSQVNDSLADNYLANLNDSDEYVRAKAARDLFEMGHPYGIRACLRTMEDGHDPAHGRYGEGVRKLMAIGEPILLPMFDSLLSKDENIRLLSETVVSEITYAMFGLVKGSETPDEQEVYLEWWRGIRYSWEAEEAQRKISVTKLKAWHAQNRLDKKSLSDKYLMDLKDSDEYVRSKAAVALLDLKHPRALEACLQTLNDGSSPANVALTPSLFALTRIGEPAFLPLLDLMMSRDELTRLRAMKSVLGISLNLFGYVNWDESREIHYVYQEWWSDIGYDEDGSYNSRKEAVDKLRTWFAEIKHDD